MKKYLALVLFTALFTGASAHARRAPFTATSPQVESLKIPEGAKSLYSVQAELVSSGMLFPHCPINAMCEPAGVATLRFTLSGCMDQLGPVSTQLERQNDGSYLLHVSAQAFSMKASELVRCYRAATAEVSVLLPVMGGVPADRLQVVSTEAFTVTQ